MRDFVIVLLITIPWLLVLGGMAVAYIYWKLKHKDIENEAAAAVIEMAAKEVVQLRMDGQNTLDHALRKSEEVNRLYERNEIIFNKNQEILKRINVDSYYLRDCSIWMYEHFKNLTNMLDKVPLQDGVNMNQLRDLKRDAHGALNNVVDFYSRKFNRHPEDTIREKQVITGVKKDGDKYLGQASIN